MQGYHHEPGTAQRMSSRPELHTGVANFMAGVYGWMGLGLAVTGAMVMGLSSSPETIYTLFNSPLYYVILFGPLVMAWMLPSRIPTMNRGLAVALFLVYAAMIGTAISPIPLIYSTGSLLGALAGTVGIFATMAILGFVTKKDLSGVAQFMVMALIGAVIGSLINALFLHSGPMSYVISVIVALVSAGLTAYYNQALKQLYMMHGAAGNLAINGALALYINFINLFLSLLRLFGNSRD